MQQHKASLIQSSQGDDECNRNRNTQKIPKRRQAFLKRNEPAVSSRLFWSFKRRKLSFQKQLPCQRKLSCQKQVSSRKFSIYRSNLPFLSRRKSSSLSTSSFSTLTKKRRKSFISLPSSRKKKEKKKKLHANRC